MFWLGNLLEFIFLSSGFSSNWKSCHQITEISTCGSCTQSFWFLECLRLTLNWVSLLLLCNGPEKYPSPWLGPSPWLTWHRSSTLQRIYTTRNDLNCEHFLNSMNKIYLPGTSWQTFLDLTESLWETRNTFIIHTIKWKPFTSLCVISPEHMKYLTCMIELKSLFCHIRLAVAHSCS